MILIETERLLISPMEPAELSELVDIYAVSAPELSLAYGEMLEGCKAHPMQYLWYTSWRIARKADGAIVGYAGFKGLGPDGSAEIGYGLESGYEGLGYATEAVTAICSRALSQPGVIGIEAETSPDNEASMRVLQKAGFVASGENGAEGPRFILSKPEK